METKRIEVKVEGISCGHCVRAVTNILEKVPGIISSDIDIATGTAIVTFDPAKTSKDKIVEEINQSETYKAS